MSQKPPLTFADKILFHARLKPEAPAIIAGEGPVSYGALARNVRIAQRRIAALGLPAGALIGLTAMPPARQIALAAAAFRLGHPIINLARVPSIDALPFRIEAIIHPERTNIVPGQRQVLCSADWFADGASDEEIPSPGFADAEAVCLVALSSGSTGRPKALASSVAALDQWLEGYDFSVGYRPWSRLLLMIGFASSWGFSIALHCLSLGRTVSLGPSIPEALKRINEYEMDVAVLSILQLRDFIGHQKQAFTPLPSLRNIVCGGSLGSQALYNEASALLCDSIFVLYGSTEAGASAMAPGHMIDDDGSVGFVTPWTRIEVVDADDQPLAPGQEGAIRLRSSGMTQPFPDDGSNTHFRGGWFYPGDMGTLSEGGGLRLNGRSNEIINSGGGKIAPDRIEEVLGRHPKVRESAAFALPGEFGIDEIAVAIVAEPGFDARELIAWSRQRHITISQVFPVDALLRSESGKILRQEISRRVTKPPAQQA